MKKIWTLSAAILFLTYCNVCSAEVSIANEGVKTDSLKESPVLMNEVDKNGSADKKIKFIGVYLNSDSLLMATDSNNTFGDEKNVSKNAFLPVSKYCYTKDEKDYYEVMYCGKGYLVEEDKINILSEDKNFLKSLDENLKIAMVENAREASIIYRLRDFDKALKLRGLFVKRGLVIAERRIYDTSEYTDGTGFSISVVNLSDKIIKYISFIVIGYNPVKDVVRGRQGKSPYITVRGVGPIKPGEGGEYDWEYLWFTDLVETHKISLIKLQYMDGSVKIYNNPESLILSEYDKYLMGILVDPDTKEVMDGVVDKGKK